MFKVGDRVVAIGGSYVGAPNESMEKQIKDKTVLTVTEIRDYRTAGFSINCKDMASSELQGFHRGSGWCWHQSELRYATDGEIKEADKPKLGDLLKREGGVCWQAQWEADMATMTNPLMAHLLGDNLGKPFASMSNPGCDDTSPGDFKLTNEMSNDGIEVSNDSEHVRLDISDEDDDNSNHAYLEPQEARDTAKALCEHADYVERMKEKAKPKQPVFKIWREGVKDEEGVVWLKLIKGMLSGDIILSVTDHLDTHRIEILRITAAQGVLVRNAIEIDGIQTDSEGRIKEAE